MSEIQIEACLICESTHIRHGFVNSGSSISQCKDCGFMFLNPQPTDEVLASIYSNGYFLDGQLSKWRQDIQDMKQNTAKLYLEELFSFYRENDIKLLDIGCGNGENISLKEMVSIGMTNLKSFFFSTSENKR